VIERATSEANEVSEAPPHRQRTVMRRWLSSTPKRRAGEPRTKHWTIVQHANAAKRECVLTKSMRPRQGACSYLEHSHGTRRSHVKLTSRKSEKVATFWKLRNCHFFSLLEKVKFFKKKCEFPLVAKPLFGTHFFEKWKICKFFTFF
jgi:hypothetical protein